MKIYDQNRNEVQREFGGVGGNFDEGNCELWKAVLTNKMLSYKTSFGFTLKQIFIHIETFPTNNLKYCLLL